MACEAFPDAVLEEVPAPSLSPRCIRAMHQRTYRGNSPCVRWAHPNPTPAPAPTPTPKPSLPEPTRCSPSRARSGRSRRRASLEPGAAGPWRGAARPRSAAGARGVSPRRRMARQSPRSEGSTTPLVPSSEVRGALGVDRLTDYRRSVRGEIVIHFVLLYCARRGSRSHVFPPSKFPFFAFWARPASSIQNPR